MQQAGTSRELVSAESLRLPPCPLPRPGDRVVWYRNGLEVIGLLLGHKADGRPYVENESPFKGTATLPSYDSLRHADPSSRVGPNWTNLPQPALIVRPTSRESEA